VRENWNIAFTGVFKEESINPELIERKSDFVGYSIGACQSD
jgi:hypothetical protein|tara:strand:- start:1225 stop:1347 length:123 start_codon:yes stop_codon:yes gene_type:complete